ncbi:hypothetical protein [Variovorax sp. PAMC 28711]|uniref:hypothetical protein n=1 Tax=Variovorax sp. PAMC 28711 TaxID=1795631 RepID=UPI0009E6B1B4|nr:hypothetical protein [Variovorax sp. PAMC 28711]
MKRFFAAGAVVLALSGCASIFNGKTQAITISSVPDGATALVVNRAGVTVHNGVTPLTLQVNRGAGYFKSEVYTITFAKEGFASTEVKLESTVSGWYIGNLLFGGLIGMIGVDPATGAMYVFPETVSSTLESKTAKTSSRGDSLTIVSTASLTPEQMKLARPLATAAQTPAAAQ